MSATKINRIHREMRDMIRLRAEFQAVSLDLMAQLMTASDLTPADLDAYMQKSQTGRKPAATAPATTGKGKRAAAATKAAPKAAAKSAAGKSPKPGNYRRGPQPAKYRDPKTGQTWSGFARPPAWIANVKDRSRFLIEQ